MRHKKLKLLILFLALAITAGLVMLKMKGKTASDETMQEISPTIGSIQVIISTTGEVLPKNRLEIKPPVPGRVESVLVVEGEKVKAGQALAYMSSTERAALLDAARGKSEKELKYWQETYKAIVLLSPIDAEVIVATTQPGQTVTAADAVVVLSDQLIVRAQVDETDIGKIKLGLKALISLDAYPDTKIKAKVDHIYYESQTVNNVTVYKVDLITETVPQFFRSGMNATVNFIVQEKQGILIIPVDAASKNGDDFVLLKQAEGKEPVKRVVKLGITDDKFVEVVSGLGPKDRIIAKAKKYSLPKNGSSGSNPFMPFGARRR